MKKTYQSNHYCIILCGGVGNRLWPYSRRRKPKQFLDLLGMGRTMLQLTYDRISRLLPQENIFLVTSKEYLPLVHEQLPSAPKSCIIGETITLSTAPSVAMASAFIYRTNPQANIVVTPADQMIVNEEDFRKQILESLEFVENTDRFVAVGVKPSYPETAYGYIQAGEEHVGDFSKIKSFTEKPNSDFARIFFESGEFYWSTGLFIFNAKNYLDTYGKQHSGFKDLVTNIDNGMSKADFVHYIEERYSSTLFQLLDMFILEHCQNVYVKVCSFGWADIGNWNSLYNIFQKDKEGNVLLGSAVELYESRNNVINVPQDKKVFVKGLENYLVSENDNILVICPKDDPAVLRKILVDAKMKYGKEME